MDQLFTLDDNRSLTILGIVCRHLASIKDLLALERVSDLTRQAVGTHQHPYEVTVCWPQHRNSTTTSDLRQGHESYDGHGNGGPIIRWLCIQIAVDSRELAGAAMDWLLKTIVQHAAHLKRLEIGFTSFPDPMSAQEFDNLNRLADAALLPSLTFPQCSWLTINFVEVYFHGGAHFLLPNLLRHFPALEVLSMVGDCVPILTRAAAPERLVTLKVNAGINRYSIKPLDHDTEDETDVINLGGLQSLTLLSRALSPWGEAEGETLRTPNLNKFTIMTQVRIIESLVTHSARLQELQMEILTDWTVALLRCPAVAGSLRSLSLRGLHHLDASLEERVEAIKQHLPGGHFPKLTQLTISWSDSERVICNFLKLAPALEELSLVIRLYEGPFYGDGGRCEMDHQLPRLRRITVNQHARPRWVDSLQRHAAPDCEMRFITTPV